MTDGFLLVDKPQDWTSHDVVERVRRLLGGPKVGHAGTLDPMATGLLVLGVGRATRLTRFIQDLPKEYRARAQLGVATDTLDATGAVLEREPLPASQREVEAVLERFRGDIMQVPPMVSAIKRSGTRLYELARRGEEVERPPRPVTIYSLELEEYAPSDYPEMVLRIVCSKGTYVRVLADDIAVAVGGRAHLTALRRFRTGSLTVGAAHTVDELERAAAADRMGALLLQPAEGLVDLPAGTVPQSGRHGVVHGAAFATSLLASGLPDEGLVRLLDDAGRLLAVYRVDGRQAIPEVVLG